MLWSKLSQSARRVRVWGLTNLCYTQRHNNNPELSTLTGISAITSSARLAQIWGVYCHPGHKLVLQRGPGKKKRTKLIVPLKIENGLCKITGISHISAERWHKEERKLRTTNSFTASIFRLNLAVICHWNISISDETSCTINVYVTSATYWDALQSLMMYINMAVYVLNK